MTGVQIAGGGHGHILRAHAAAADPLDNTRAAVQVDHIVIKSKAVALAITV